MCQTEAGAPKAGAPVTCVPGWVHGAGTGGQRQKAALQQIRGCQKGQEGQEELMRFEEGAETLPHLAWATYPQPIDFLTWPISSSTTPSNVGCPCFMLQPLHTPLRTLVWEDERNQVVRGCHSCSFCLLGSGLPVFDPPWSGSKRKSKRLHLSEWAFQGSGARYFLPWPKQSRWSDITYIACALSLLWTQCKDDKHSLTPLCSLHEKNTQTPGVRL